ncbi:hypothetical protein MW887_003529 [Aspergillus wentii]|nr:hypothetical protein MW887_003529 [Aspergillus wentii]
MADFGMLSPDGRSRSFDANAKGYARGEGVCAVILKLVGDAETNQDHIRAVIRASAMNHDGAKNGITLPNDVAQEALIRRTYEEANIATRDTAYFEAHGTGTKAGDPREARAIGRVFCSDDRPEPLYIGSVKSCIGHLEGAAGLAAVIKVVLSIEKGKIAPNMHFSEENPDIEFDRWRLRVPTEVVDWPRSYAVKRASVNSFGYGGSNCHVVLEAYLQHSADDVPFPTQDGRLYLIPISTHSETAGKRDVKRLAAYLDQHPNTNLSDLAYTLSVRRAIHPLRTYVVAGSTREISLLLMEKGESPDPWTRAGNCKKIGFVFTGQGAQWAHMGARLVTYSAVFRQTLERCDALLKTLPDAPEWSIMDELLKEGGSSRVNDSEFSQPLCTAVQLALVHHLREWGVTPSATVGHSSGEIAAAYAAGLISLSTAMVTSFFRGRYTSSKRPEASLNPGGMLAVGMPLAEAKRAIEPYQSRICVAAINSPSSITLSGDLDAITALKSQLDERKVFARQLMVAQAYHSHHMTPFAEKYQQSMEASQLFERATPSDIPMFSSVTARGLTAEKLDARYWVDNLVSPVRFSDALTGTVLDELDTQQIDVLLEVGPHPALKGPVKQTLAALNTDIPYIGTLQRNNDDFSAIINTAGQLFLLGYPLVLDHVNMDSTRSSQIKWLGNLPTYGWNHAKYWAQSRLATAYLQRKYRHFLLGVPQPDSTQQTNRWRHFLRLSEVPWLADHRIQGSTVFPAAGYVSLAVEAGFRAFEGEQRSIRRVVLHNVTIKSALKLTENEPGVEIVFELRSISSTGASASWQFLLCSYNAEGQSREHCNGTISIELGSPMSLRQGRKHDKLARQIENTGRIVSCMSLYEKLSGIGLQYSGRFMLPDGRIDSSPGFATASLSWGQSSSVNQEEDQCLLDPAFLDTSFHPIFAAIEAANAHPLTGALLPTSFRTMEISGLALDNEDRRFLADARVLAEAKQISSRSVEANHEICTSDGATSLVSLDGLVMTAVGEATQTDIQRSPFQRIHWLPAFIFLDDTDSPAVGTAHHMTEMLSLYAHQYPNSSILHITSDLTTPRDLLQILGGRTPERRRYNTLTAFADSEDLKETEAARILQNDGWAPISWDAPHSQTYDLVVMSHATSLVPGNLLKDGGFILRPAHVDWEPSQSLVKRFSHHEIECWQERGSKAPVVNSPGAIGIVRTHDPADRTMAIISILETLAKRPALQTSLDEIAHGTVQIPEDIVVLSSLDDDVLCHMSNSKRSEFEGVKAMATMRHKRIIWVLEGGTYRPTNQRQALINGMMRCLRSENNLLRIIVLDVSQGSDAECIAASVQRLLADTDVGEDEIAVRDGILYIPRLVMEDSLNRKLHNGYGRVPTMEFFHQSQHLKLDIGGTGRLDSAMFEACTLEPPLGDDELEIQVHAFSVTPRWLQTSLGKSLGSEAQHSILDGGGTVTSGDCAGIVKRKGRSIRDQDFVVADRVVVLRPPGGSHRNVIRCAASCCRRIYGQDFKTAASWPSLLSAVCYSLIHVAQVQRGEYILIDAVDSGFGQMATQLAQHLGAIVLAVTRSVEQKHQVMRLVPSLINDQILVCDSDEGALLDYVLSFTNSRGVSVLLSNRTGHISHFQQRLLMRLGRYINFAALEPLRGDAREARTVTDGSSTAPPGIVSFHLDLDSLIQHKPSIAEDILKQAQDYLQRGIIQLPGNTSAFPVSQAPEALHWLQSERTASHVVLTSEVSSRVLIRPVTYRPNPNLFDQQKKYLLVGALTGIGAALAEWMARNGARHLVFLSRSGDRKPGSQSLIQWLKARGVHCSVHAGDVCDTATVERCVASIGTALGGVFHAAAVYQDSPLHLMSFDQWKAALAPKLNGLEALDQATAHRDLDFFICFSSVSVIIGTKAQANYIAGNAVMDALMYNRRQRGLAGMTMNVGVVADQGVVARDPKLRALLERNGYGVLDSYELFCQVEEAVRSGKPPFPPTEQGPETHQIISGSQVINPSCFWYHRPLFRGLAAHYEHEKHGSGSFAASGSDELDLKMRINSTPDAASRVELLLSVFITQWARISGIPSDQIEPSRSLASYGLDSLGATDARNWFLKTVGVDIPVFEIFDGASIQTLIAHVVDCIPVLSLEQEDRKEGPERAGEPVSPSLTQIPSDSISRQHRPEKIPMSSHQRRFWYLHNLVLDKAHFNVPVVCHLNGVPGHNTLRQALAAFRQRNEILRTAFVQGDDFPEQVPLDLPGYDIPFIDLSTAADPQQALVDRKSQLRALPLNIEEGETMRLELVKTGVSQYSLLASIHHIICDRGSSSSLLTQMCALYDAIAAGHREHWTVPPVSIQYIDFTLWQQDLLLGPAMQEHLAFWRQKLADIPPVSALLPFAKNERPTPQIFRTSTHYATLDPNYFARLRRIFPCCCIPGYLFGHTGEEDLVIHMVDGRRPHPDVEQSFGNFLNLIPLRLLCESNSTFESLLSDVKKTVLEALTHSIVPFDRILEELRVKPSRSHFPLGQVAFNYQIHGQMLHYRTADFVIDQYITEDIETPCEVQLEAIEDAKGGLGFRLQSSEGVYNSSDMSAFLGKFVTSLEWIIKDHRQPIAEIPIFPIKDQDFCSGMSPGSSNEATPLHHRGIAQAIAHWASKTPAAIALTDSSGVSLTYAQLVEGAQRVAAMLQAMGSRPGDHVGILSSPGIDMLLGLLGIVFCRCGYVAMDPQAGVERLIYMANDSGSSIILIGDGLSQDAVKGSPQLDGFSQRLVSIKDALRNPTEAAVPVASADDPLYVTYTSGSTGTPKGVVMRHRNALPMLQTLQAQFCFGPQDRFLLATSISFDLSVVQIFTPLMVGGRVCIASEETRHDPISLGDFMRSAQVTFTYFTPTQFAMVLENAPDTLKACRQWRHAFFCGEVLPVRLLNAFYDLGTGAAPYNAYGPCEAMVQVAIHHAEYLSHGVSDVPIGRPLETAECFIVDETLQNLPDGEIGEICIGGPQVGDGYLNQPQETAKSFLPSKTSRESKVFRTGDLGYVGHDGLMHFVGRAAGDTLIKLRGFRIDLQDIQHNIRDCCPEITAACVVARSLGDEDSTMADRRQLVAFVVLSMPSDKQAIISRLHRALHKRLSLYMLPSAYQVLSALPLTISGKTDRRSLIQRPLQLIRPMTSGRETNGKSGSVGYPSIVEFVRSQFYSILKSDPEQPVGADDSFVAIGGQSMLLMTLQGKINQHFSVKTLLADLLALPTPAGIALTIQRALGYGDKTAVETHEPAHSSGPGKTSQPEVDWEQETLLPLDNCYQPPLGGPYPPTDRVNVLVAGVDTFQGIHLLWELLAHSTVIIHVIGTTHPIKHSDLLQQLQRFALIPPGSLYRDMIWARARCYPGDLTRPHFGLTDRQFTDLGAKVQMIYSVGTQVSLVQGYTNQKEINMKPVLDTIELAACGPHVSQIHHLSTYSVLHLQSWTHAQRSRAVITAAEEAPSSFRPPPTNDQGYIKARWVAEIILTKAADRGIPVTIYRAAPPTASTQTGASPPAKDPVSLFALTMLKTGLVPRLGSDQLRMVIDLVPVDVLASWMHCLSMSAPREPGPEIRGNSRLAVRHLVNPSPLPLEQLPAVISGICEEVDEGQLVALDTWIARVGDTFVGANEHDMLLWTALVRLFRSGHVIFPLDRAQTEQALDGCPGALVCPPVDRAYLAGLL